MESEEKILECEHRIHGGLCKNNFVKKSLFGAGPRYCVLCWHEGLTCSYCTSKENNRADGS